MAITFIGSYVGTHAATSAQTINFSLLRNESNVAPTLLQNDLVLVAVQNASTVDRTEAQLTPSGYTACHTDNYQNDSNDSNFLVSRKFMGATPDSTVAIPASNATTAGVAYAVYVFRGVDTTTPLDVAAVVTGAINTGVANAPAIVPSTQGAWIVVFGGAAVAAGAVFTNPAGMSTTTNHFRSATITTTTTDANIGGAIFTGWTSGSYDPAAFGGSTTTNTGSWSAVTIALRPSISALLPSLFTNNQTFHAPAITVGTATLAATLFANEQIFYGATVQSAAAGTDLTPSLFTNSQTFFAPTIAQVTNLAPTLFTNTQTFYGATVTATRNLTPALFTNAQTFFSPARTSSNAVAPTLVTNNQTFYGATISRVSNVTPALFTNSQTFYAPAVTATRALTPALFTNSQTFYGPTATRLNIIAPPMFADSDFIFPPVVTQPGGPQVLTASLFTNTNTFFTPTVVDPPAQPILSSGSIVRPRRKFRPAILIDLPEEDRFSDVSAKAILAGLSASVTVGSVVAKSPDPIDSRALMAFTQIEAYMPRLAARSSWNDPSDEELLFILDFALD
jgi:hypothetical protein